MEKPRPVGISSHTAPSGKKSSFLPHMYMCSHEDIFPPSLSHELPLAGWQERCIPEAHGSSTPRDAARSCGWRNRWALSGAELDTQTFCTVKALGTAVKAFKKICEPLNISSSVVRTELSECLWFQLIPISQKLMLPAFKICSHKGASTCLRLFKHSSRLLSSYTAVSTHTPREHNEKYKRLYKSVPFYVKFRYLIWEKGLLSHWLTMWI